MINITHKSNTLRQAIAVAKITVSNQSTIDAINNRLVPKGDIFEFSRAAGLLGIKKTSDIIPDCHPLPIEFAQITYELNELSIIITVEVHTIYKTGVEVEAMHGASVVALTIYDMLKPIDKAVEISHIHLVSKKGGKSDIKLRTSGLTAAVVVCSDTISAGKVVDKAGELSREKLLGFGIKVDKVVVVPDEISDIQDKARKYSQGVDARDIIIFVGGTGLSNRDVTPEAIAPLITREIEGLMETARAYGQQRMPFAMMSRSIAGMINETLVIVGPGSSKGAVETIDALFPAVLHIFDIKDGQRHANQ